MFRFYHRPLIRKLDMCWARGAATGLGHGGCAVVGVRIEGCELLRAPRVGQRHGAEAAFRPLAGLGCINP